jgi:spoIIIJ-associated protein
MRFVEKRGRSVEEAVALGLEELGAGQEDVNIEILEEASKGLFGILGLKGARVKITLKETRAEVAERFVSEVVSAMGFESTHESKIEEGYLFINVRGRDLGSLIGRRGQTLNALQYLVNLAAAKGTVGTERVVLDVEGYRIKREQTLRALAQRLADKVRRFGQSIMLEPMSAQERRIVHTTLQNNPYVMTKSEGEEPFRKVIIYAKR